MNIIVTVKRATAIQCWDVFVNGQRVDRFDRKYLALQSADTYKSLISRRPGNVA